MKELLDRLKQIDPTTYKRYNTDKIICDMYLVIAVKDAWLQACLQDAISGKGWQGIVLFNKERNRAVIEDIIDGWGGTRKLSEEIGDSAANALLAAYIAACEAMT